jgi:thiol:disulfide interchange protein DsbD
MERLKQFMGFPLAATLLWLLYVIGQQRGTEAVSWASAAYLCLALAAWHDHPIRPAIPLDSTDH